MDHLGKFLSFFIGCLEIAHDKLRVDENVSVVQLSTYRKIVDQLVEKIQNVTMEQLDIFSTLNIKTSETISQFLNCLEALMVHCSNDLLLNDNITGINKLFAKHQAVMREALKLQDNHKKSTKKGKNQTIDAVAKVEIRFECVWSLEECGKFTELIFGENANEKINEIKQNHDFCRFVLKSMSVKIAQLVRAPEHLKVKHSRSMFATLKKYSALLYKQIELNAFEKLFDNFDEESAVALCEAFMNSVVLMTVVYSSPVKWKDYLKKLTNSSNSTDSMIMEVIKLLQKIVDWAFDPERDVADNLEKIVVSCFTAIEALFQNFQVMPNPHVRDVYNWLLGFCKRNELDQKNLHIINRVFIQVMAQQDSSGKTMEHVASKITSIYGHLEEIDAVDDASQNDLKSITAATVDQVFVHFAGLIRKQIDDIEFCILRMNSFNAHVKIPGQDSRDSATALNALEQSSVIKLKQLGTVIGQLCNARFTLRGGQIDQIVKITISYFTCLLSLMKHFGQHHDVKKIDFQAIPLEILMRETKSTVKRVYALNEYFEDLVKDEQANASKEGKKKSAAKELRNISRLVFMIEKFAAVVQKVDGQTKKNFSKHIHVGQVRGFIIDYSKKAGSKTAKKRAADLSEDDSEKDEDSEEQSSESEDESVAKNTSRNRIADSSSDEDEPLARNISRNRIVDSSSEEAVASGETNASSYESPIPVVRGGFEKNLKKMATKAKKTTVAKGRKRKM